MAQHALTIVLSFVLALVCMIILLRLTGRTKFPHRHHWHYRQMSVREPGDSYYSTRYLRTCTVCQTQQFTKYSSWTSRFSRIDRDDELYLLSRYRRSVGWHRHRAASPAHEGTVTDGNDSLEETGNAETEEDEGA